jgi:ELWxxDGT repeat protein
MNGLLYFKATNGTNGEELWKSDGTPAGTVEVKDIYTGAIGSVPDDLTIWDNKLYFAANDDTHGREIWVSDGTAIGTQILKNIKPFGLSSNPSNFVVVNNVLFFSADDGISGYEWWYTDGTAAQTNLLADVNPGLGASAANRNEIAPLGNDKMICTALKSGIGKELLQKGD